MSSERLPGKVLADLGGRTVLEWVVRAARQSGVCDRTIVATSSDPSDDAIEDETRRLDVEVFRGDLDDVLIRFLGALNGLPRDTSVVRLTADCPFLDPSIIAMAVRAFEYACVDYLSTIRTRSLPRGLDVEVVRLCALQSIEHTAVGYQRSHVTPAIYENPDAYSLAGIAFEPPSSDLRVTIDTIEDMTAMREIVSHLGDRVSDRRKLVSFMRNNPQIAAINAEVVQKDLADG